MASQAMAPSAGSACRASCRRPGGGWLCQSSCGPQRCLAWDASRQWLSLATRQCTIRRRRGCRAVQEHRPRRLPERRPPRAQHALRPRKCYREDRDTDKRSMGARLARGGTINTPMASTPDRRPARSPSPHHILAAQNIHAVRTAPNPDSSGAGTGDRQNQTAHRFSLWGLTKPKMVCSVSGAQPVLAACSGHHRPPCTWPGRVTADRFVLHLVEIMPPGFWCRSLPIQPRGSAGLLLLSLFRRRCGHISLGECFRA